MPSITPSPHRSVSRRGALALTTGLAVALLAACGGADSAAVGGPASGGAPSAKNLDLLVPGVITAGTQTEQAPYAFTAADGSPTGFSVDLMNESAKRLGVKVDYKFTNLQGILSGITAGKYDVGVAGVVATDERKKSVDFLKPFNWAFQDFLTPVASTEATLSDFDAKRVGVVTGSVQETFAAAKMPGAQVIRFKDQPAAMAQLLAGGLDAFLVGSSDAQVYLEKEKGKLRIALETELPAGTSAPVRKGNTALVTALDDTIDAMIADGTYKQLYDKYFKRPFSPQLLAERPTLAKYATATPSQSAGSPASGASPSKTP